MKRIIEIDSMDSSYLYEMYNSKKVSRDLINYLIESSLDFRKNDTIEIIINNKLKNKEHCISIIKEGLKSEYFRRQKLYRQNNIIQFIYLIIGIIVLSLSTLIELEVFREVVIISGWVLIWSMIELEIFSNIENKKIRKTLKKLLNSKIIDQKI